MAKDTIAVRLSPQAIAMIDALVPLGLFGTSRGEVARSLILDQLKKLAAEKIVDIKPTDQPPTTT